MEKTIELRLDTEEIKRMLTEKKDSEPKQNPHRKNVIELYAWCKEMLNLTHSDCRMQWKWKVCSHQRPTLHRYA